MSIQHFAAAPGQIISFLLSCCVKSTAARSTLLIAGGEEPRRAALLPSEAERGVAGGGREERSCGSLCTFPPSSPLVSIVSPAGLFLFWAPHENETFRGQVWAALRCAWSERPRCSRSAVTSQSEVNAVKTFGHLKVNVEHINGDENSYIFIYPSVPNHSLLFVLNWPNTCTLL